jgi:bifunctional non-homologous end joining protein LigD
MSADSLQPQAPSKAKLSIESPNWSFEPFWPGVRLIATVVGGTVSLTDDEGADVTPNHAEAAAALADAIYAEAAIIDGIWTAQPFLGAASAERWAHGLDEDGDEPVEIDPLELETRRAFVAVDLLELDGTSLLDVPYQERRRLLGSVVREDGHVRVTPAVKVPVNSWFMAWRTNGFQRALAKQVNSRYLPGRINSDWVIIPLRADIPRATTRLVWKGRKTKQITD